MTEKKNLYQKLADVQNELKCPKNQYNSFGKYHYRSAEDILETAKPTCIKHGLLLSLSDEIKAVGERHYICAYATVADMDNPEARLTIQGNAREPMAKKGMDESQITGCASSYARKYALNGLFSIDDTKDADALPPDNAKADPANGSKNEDNLNTINKASYLTAISSRARGLKAMNYIPAIIESHYGVKSSKEMTPEQCMALYNNLDVWINEAKGRK